MDTMKRLGAISLGSRLKRLSEHLMREVQQVYKELDIDFDPYLFPAFQAIATGDGITNSMLYESLGLTQPAVTQTLNKLLAKELVVFETDPSDKRRKFIRLSMRGNRLFHRLKPMWKIMHEEVERNCLGASNSLMEHMERFEDALNSGNMIQTIRDRIKNELHIEILPFNPKYAQEFFDFNIEWLETYFYVEDFDREVLSKPEKYILDPGGYIFFAKYGEEIIGTVALMKYKENAYELTKMAVSPNYRGMNAGQLLMQHCIDFATSEGFDNLMLYSNTILENAIHIYRKYGFVEIPVEPDSPYERSNIKMLLNLSA